jgi:hypothetical protein
MKIHFLAIALLTAAFSAHAQIRVINVIPNSLSDETNNDGEPNLAVDPVDPRRIVVSALTPDPLNGPNAPLFVSTDGGTTWSLRSIVPGNNPTSGTNDITVRFGSGTGMLYVAFDRGDQIDHMHVSRSSDLWTLTELFDRHADDQPYVEATTGLGGSIGVWDDHVFVGSNREPFFFGVQSATVDGSVHATGVPPAGFTPATPAVIESRTPAGQDGPAIRTAIHSDGTVYGLFYSWTAGVTGTVMANAATANVVIVRSDLWGTDTPPFSGLAGGDTLPGQTVVSGVSVAVDPWGLLGSSRLVSSNLSIAVDPRNSDRVYVVWADQNLSTGWEINTLHVRRSDDRGQTWTSDLMTIPNATNPSLAVTGRGTVGFLYQMANDPFWETHFQRSYDEGTTWHDVILATFIDYVTPSPVPQPFLGDYDHVMAVGKDFYGVFSSWNAPDLGNFPMGVTPYQRNADWTNHVLHGVSGVTVNPSIDPFVFQVTDTAPGDDYYVRDWTSSFTSADNGAEPSSDPYFFVTSDVWNQTTNSVHPFNGNDQPNNDDPQSGIGSLGDNYLFARVHRKAQGAAGTAGLHFLFSEFGTGSNFQAANPFALDPTLTFSPTSTAEILALGFPWRLQPTASTHLCLAVEITGPNDPYIPPSLTGYAPGWPVTDLRVLNDNNKAQRNVQVIPHFATATGEFSGWAIVHNAATVPRMVALQYDVPDTAPAVFVQSPGRPRRPIRGRGVVNFENMEPGENRWLRVTFGGLSPKGGSVPINFVERVGNSSINGFTIEARSADLRTVLKSALAAHRAVFARLAALTNIDLAADESRAAAALLDRDPLPETEYRQFVREHSAAITSALSRVDQQVGWKPLPAAPLTGEIGAIAAAHLTVLNDLDAALTARRLADGDPADILQTVRWQSEIFREIGGAEDIVSASRTFVAGYTARKLHNADYPTLIKSLLDADHRAVGGLPNATEIERAIATMESNLDSLPALQKAHHAFLLALQGARKAMSR